MRTATPHAASDWDAFWRGHNQTALQEQAGVRDPAPADFWKRFFARTPTGGQPRKLVDVACGNGAVTEIALGADAVGDVHCLDSSLSAVAELRGRLPEGLAVVGDAAELPYPDGSFDLVVSQFGIEYAGETAFGEAARIVADGGELTTIAHQAGSPLHRECADNLSLVAAFDRTGLMQRSREGFGAGFSTAAGTTTRARLQEHGRQLAAAADSANALLSEARPCAARNFMANALRDVVHMYSRLRAYEPDKVFAWLDAIEGELAAYEGRMKSMVDCALDEAAVARVTDLLRAAGLKVDVPQALTLDGSGEPGGWILSARRPDSRA